MIRWAVSESVLSQGIADQGGGDHAPADGLAVQQLP